MSQAILKARLIYYLVELCCCKAHFGDYESCIPISFAFMFFCQYFFVYFLTKSYYLQFVGLFSNTLGDKACQNE